MNYQHATANLRAAVQALRARRHDLNPCRNATLALAFGPQQRVAAIWIAPLEHSRPIEDAPVRDLSPSAVRHRRPFLHHGLIEAFRRVFVTLQDPIVRKRGAKLLLLERSQVGKSGVLRALRCRYGHRFVRVVKNPQRA